MKYLYLVFLISVFLSGGCCCKCRTEKNAVNEAKELIRAKNAECVLIREGKICVIERGHGVSPLLDIYKAHKEKMKDGIIVDKVIGRAAASIAICGKVRHMHGEVMSEDAVAFLKKNGITTSHTLLVPRILNQKRNGLCPLEKSVEGIGDPEKALIALQKKIESLRSRKHTNITSKGAEK